MSFWKKSPLKVRVITRDILKLRLSEWRSDRALVSKGIQLHANPDFRLALEVLRNESPANFVLPDACPLDVRAMYQSRAEGYTLALANLEALAKFDAITEPLEATFELDTETQE